MCQMFHESVGTPSKKRRLLVDLKKKNSKISLRKVDHKNKLYVFSKFFLKTPTLALLMHSNDVSNLWHDMFGHINLYVNCIN